MENRNVVDKRQVRLEELMREDYIPFLEGRPGRDTVLSTDDVTNLKIALNTSLSFEEFLEHV
ncbi:MAG: hypothetical protein GF418_11625 [Chitinivibrionales bacterium]|nr:hypothetical protein [Chitinivibrionales bacterium]MBD3396265.1 hypothetical protein [Chitinivibrionales bacterium]